MKSHKIKLPSNSKFGYFFCIFFLFFAIYFFYISNSIAGFILLTLSFLFVVITLIDANLLYPLNKFWMYFGIVIGRIVNPFILGTIFFGMLTPYSIVFRIIGRDELRLKQTKNKSYWLLRANNLPQTNFKQQF